MLKKRSITGKKRHHLTDFHPAKGSVIKVEPIRKKKDIDTIKKMLEKEFSRDDFSLEVK